MGASVWTEQIPSGKWRVIWRNIAKQTADGRALKGKGSVSVTDRATARKLEVHVRTTIDLQHYYVHEAPPELQIANFSTIAADYIRFKRDNNGCPDSTVEVYLSGFKRIATTARGLAGLADGAPIPVTLLSVEFCTSLKAVWREQVGAHRVYDLSLYLYSAWRWAASQPKRYPGIPMPPLDASLVLPPAPIRVAAPEPTVRELDAVCRRAAASPVRDLNHIVATMRLTGLRIGQVLAMRAHDFDLNRRVMIVATGKSKREKAGMREVPIHDSLVNLLRPRIEACGREALLFPASRGTELRKAPGGAVSTLWVAATAAGEVREWVWKPRNRGKARPDHAFRAGFLGALREAGVVAEVRHAIVGHAAESTEARHYSGVTENELRKGIDALPAIDWIGPESAGNVTPMRATTGLGAALN